MIQLALASLRNRKFTTILTILSIAFSVSLFLGVEKIRVGAKDSFSNTISQTDLQCFGDVNGSVTVTVNSGGSGAGYTYVWAPNPPAGQGTPTASGLTTGIWTVTMEDALLCDTTL